MPAKRALIFGIGGQDGSYLAELLLDKGYEVHGTARRSSVDNLVRLTSDVWKRVTVHRCDLTDHLSVHRVLTSHIWQEVYNMADQDHVGWSADTPAYSAAVTYGGPAAILESLRGVSELIRPRFFQPVSATMYGPGQHYYDDNRLLPASPYACAKAGTFLLCQHYRREYGLYVSCGIMYNHDSPRRGPDYLLQKIVRYVRDRRDLSNDLQTIDSGSKLTLYNIDDLVDVGYAREYVDAAWRMLQQHKPDDYPIATCRPASIRDVCHAAFEAAGMLLCRYLAHIDRPGTDRPPTCDVLEPIKTRLGWEPRYDATTLAAAMVKGVLR